MSEGCKMTEIGTIPQSWDIVRLNEFADILNNLRIPLSSEVRASMKGSFPYCGANGIVDYINDYKFDGEFILVAEDGGNFHEFQTRPIAYLMNGKFWVNNHAHVLRAKNGLNKFLFYSLEHKNITKYIIGSTRTKLNRSVLETIPIAKPAMHEQQKIAEILSTVDEKIEVIDAQIGQTTELKKGLMQKLLTKGIGHTQFKDSPLGEIPESWNVVELNSIFKNVVVGFVGSISDHYCGSDVGIPFIRTLNVKDGYFDLKGIEYVTKSFHQRNKKSQIYNEDILIARVGANMGLVCKVNGLKSEANAANVIIIKSDKDACSDFYSNFLSSSEGQKQIHSQGIGGAQEVFNTSLAKKLKIPVPSYSEQLKIAEILTVINEKIGSLQNKKENYKELKKGLMQQLLTGKIRVNQSIRNNDSTKPRHLQTATES